MCVCPHFLSPDLHAHISGVSPSSPPTASTSAPSSSSSLAIAVRLFAAAQCSRVQPSLSVSWLTRGCSGSVPAVRLRRRSSSTSCTRPCCTASTTSGETPPCDCGCVDWSTRSWVLLLVELLEVAAVVV